MMTSDTTPRGYISVWRGRFRYHWRHTVMTTGHRCTGVAWTRAKAWDQAQAAMRECDG